MHGRGIRAARDRARDTADFQTNGRCFCSHNTSAPQNGIFIQTPQGLARRGFKNQNPARGRSVENLLLYSLLRDNLRTRTPQGDGAYLQPPLPERGRGTA